MKEDFYQVLQIQKEASDDEIKKAYKKLALKCHPDKGGEPEMFKKVSEAYSVLSDPEKRKVYDTYGHEGLEGGDGMPDPTDIFANIFGGGGFPPGFGFPGFAGPQRNNQQPRDKIEELEVSLEDVYLGRRKQVTIERFVVNQNEVRSCTTCKGQGMRVHIHRIGPMIQQQVAECDACGGSGNTVDTKHIETRKEELMIDIPMGAPEGLKLRLEGKANDFPGRKTGDLIFVIRYRPHKNFVVDETNPQNLITTLNLNLYESVTGFSRVLKHLDNSSLKLTSKQVIKPGDMKELRGEGLTFQGNRGSLIIKFNIEFPKELIREQTTALSSALKMNSQICKGDSCRELYLSSDYEQPQTRRQQRPQQVQECTHQ